jgi:hypothetical protein
VGGAHNTKDQFDISYVPLMTDWDRKMSAGMIRQESVDNLTILMSRQCQ